MPGRFLFLYLFIHLSLGWFLEALLAVLLLEEGGVWSSKGDFVAQRGVGERDVEGGEELGDDLNLGNKWYTRASSWMP